MIASRDIKRIFREELPDVVVDYVNHERFLRVALLNKFVQAQIEAGIYEDVEDEFLTSAMSFVPFGLVYVDVEQMVRLMEDVPRTQALAWVRWTARHEAMHFAMDHRNVAPENAAQAELDVNQHIEHHFPRLHAASQQAENVSSRFQRVLTRIQ